MVYVVEVGHLYTLNSSEIHPNVRHDDVYGTGMELNHSALLMHSLQHKKYRLYANSV